MKQKLSDWWADYKAKHWWVDHLVFAWKKYKDNHGDHFAAAITYFSFLALFPTILLGVSITGYVLNNNQDLQNKLFTKIEENLPGGFGDEVGKAISSAIDARAGVGIVGLLGLAYTGLGWIGNLRAAIVAVWGQTPAKMNFVKAKLLDLIVLAGLGLGVVISIGLTAVGTSLADQITRQIDLPGGAVFVEVVGLVLPLAGDMLVFSWVLTRLPKTTVPLPILLRGALLTSVGFEILKIVGTYYIARVSQSPALGIFGSIIGILVWIDLVSRYVLYCASWTATAHRTPQTELVTTIELPADAPVPTAPTVLSPIGLAASLVGVGAAAGAGVMGVLMRRRVRHG